MLHQELDEFKLQISRAVLECASLLEIREKSLANIARWEARGTGGYEKWRDILLHTSDAELVGIMTGLDENSNWLRQSMPYVGIISEGTRERIWAVAVAASDSREQSRKK